MSTIVRGIKGAVRNPIRTFGVTVILALSTGLALVMLLSLKTVQARIETVKASIGNTVTVSPAGARGFEGGGEPLTQAQVESITSLAHVKSVSSTLQDRLTPTTDTSLVSAIDAGTLGNRAGRQNNSNTTEQAPPQMRQQGTTTRTFTIPIMVTGATKVSGSVLGTSDSAFKITSGAAIDASSSTNTANVGKTLAEKNNLKVGSTFTAYSGTTFTVTGIYDAGNTFANAGLILPLATVQKLSDQAGEVSSATVTIDDITNVNAAVTAIKAKITTADVTSQQDQAQTALTPLENIKTISLYSLIGSLVAGSVIIFLTMLMIVRERRREIGVLKAIGSSNIKIVLQFVTEALTLTGLGAIVGVIGGVLLSAPVLKLLVTTNSTTTTMGGPGGGRGFGRAFGGVTENINSLHTVVGYDILLYGLLAAVVIAIVGSALPAFAIAKVRPAEVMRGE